LDFNELCVYQTQTRVTHIIGIVIGVVAKSAHGIADRLLLFRLLLRDHRIDIRL